MELNYQGSTLSIIYYIDNIIWFKPSVFRDTAEIRNNINILLLKYKQYFFNDLDKLKIEIFNIPENKFFQNHIQFVIGVCNNELNTKIAYHSN